MDLKKVDIFAYVDNFKIHEHIDSIKIKDSEKDNYFLTIFIPTYKRPKELKEALDSALNQEGNIFEYEVVVVDNNPERGDETEQLIATYTNSNLSYYKNSENLGLYGNWNRGYLLAKGEWVTMLHDDDMLYPYFLKITKGYLERVNCAFIPKQIPGNEYKYSPQPKEISYHKLHAHYFMIQCFVGPPVGLTIRKNNFIATGGFNPKLYPSADYYWHVMFVNKFQLNQILQSIVFYRMSVGTTKKPETKRQTIIQDYFLKRQLIKKVTKMPYCVINCILGIDVMRRKRAVIKKTGFDCGFELSDINVNSKFYIDPKFSLLRLIIWTFWRLYVYIITRKIPKKYRVNL